MNAADHSRMPSLLADPLEAMWIDELTGQIVDCHAPGEHRPEERSMGRPIAGLDSVPQAGCSPGEQLAFDFVERDSGLHRLTGLQGTRLRLLQFANSRPRPLARGGVP
jgi:hypothetical protein